MKTILCSFLAILLSIAVYSQTIIPGGPISGTWTVGGSPYLIEGETSIEDGTTLTIEPGVDVIWQNDSSSMWVQGQILARGTASDSIIFTAADPQTGWKGIRFDNTPSSNDSSEFVYCMFEYADAYGDNPDNSGGAIAALNFGKILINHCSFCENKALDISIYPNPIGGAIGLDNCSPIIRNCLFKNNESYAGGAIACFGGSSPIIENNLFTNNTAIGAEYAQGYGGAICCYLFCSPLIRNNTFAGNTVTNGGGAIAMVSQCNPTIDHNLIFGNSSQGLGGGIEIQDTCHPIIINNTIAHNEADYGGGIDFWGKSQAEISNTIIWGNTATTQGNQVNLMDSSSMPEFHFCDIEGGRTAFGGVPFTGAYEDCFKEDPLFAGPPDYHITWSNAPVQDTTMSPCIDTGNPIMFDPDATRCDVGVFYFDQFWIGIADTRFNKSDIKIECYPNPAFGIFDIRYSISDIRSVFIAVYDITGKQVSILANEKKVAGEYNVKFNAHELAEGLYIIRLQAGNESAVGKLLIVH